MKLLKRLAFRGGEVFFFCGGGGEQDTTPAGSRKHLTTRPKMTRASIWPSSAQDLRFRGGGVFVSKTPEITTFWGGCPVFWEGGGGTRDHPGRIAKPLENKAQHDTCNNLAHLCPRSTFQRGFLLTKPRKGPRFGGGGGYEIFFGGGDGSKRPSSKAPTAQRLPRFHVLELRNIILAAVWRHVLGFTFRTPRFRT